MADTTAAVPTPEASWLGRTRHHRKFSNPQTKQRVQGRMLSASPSLEVLDKERRICSRSAALAPSSQTSLNSAQHEEDLDREPACDKNVAGEDSSSFENSMSNTSGTSDSAVEATIMVQRRRIAQLEKDLSISQAEIQRLRLIQETHIHPIEIQGTALPAEVLEVESKKSAKSECSKPESVLVVPGSDTGAGEVRAEDDKKASCRYWTQEEHKRFLEGLELYGHKDIKGIARHVGTRNATQVRTHAQKYYLRLARETSKENPGENLLEAFEDPRTRPSIDSHSGAPVPQAALDAAKEQFAKLASRSQTENGEDSSEAKLEKKSFRNRGDPQSPRKRLKSKTGLDGTISSPEPAKSVVEGSDYAHCAVETNSSRRVQEGLHLDSCERDSTRASLARTRSMQTIMSLLSSNPTTPLEHAMSAVEGDGVMFGDAAMVDCHELQVEGARLPTMGRSMSISNLPSLGHNEEGSLEFDDMEEEDLLRI
mmetsp:Transcript_17528/g.36393  ORF Transcript_17528/g.36393 Transcript_17528/m.36393 type:complete len:482 (-) Transcript_17528:482-1927(-)|eukprot:CAMPEP_0184689804 /NCGR_PEP_ID=MMETSP0312-20130426/30856_1 /TAXON_ID=31354 /ORGANISM="Compsopogon coeruleus, Strain SAG 36.94" /LENGTH=481 /DNA_ID=CAMNT_0027147193 /DNA_START=175 /DNA_END=1620 /DNA_ORIENTATION=-